MNDPKSKELSSGTESSDSGAELQASTVDYDIVALSMPIYYNREGDHDHNGMLFVLEANVPILEYIEALARQGSRRKPGVQTPNLQTLFAAAAPRSQDIEVHLRSPRSRQDGRILWSVRWCFVPDSATR